MRVLDANVFIYAYYKPKRELTEKQKQMKEHAKEIIRKINEGEEVMRCEDINEIYSFDKGFDDVVGIKKVP